MNNDLGKITERINSAAKKDGLDLFYTKHSKEQMKLRDITTSDILSVLRLGNVVECQGESTRSGIYKYEMQGRYPKDDLNRTIALIICYEPGCRKVIIKIKMITAMWADEERIK